MILTLTIKEIVRFQKWRSRILIGLGIFWFIFQAISVFTVPSNLVGYTTILLIFVIFVFLPFKRVTNAIKIRRKFVQNQDKEEVKFGFLSIASVIFTISLVEYMFPREVYTFAGVGVVEHSAIFIAALMSTGNLFNTYKIFPSIVDWFKARTKKYRNEPLTSAYI